MTLLSDSQKLSGRFFSDFVCFSECPNFKQESQKKIFPIFLKYYNFRVLTHLNKRIALNALLESIMVWYILILHTSNAIVRPILKMCPLHVLTLNSGINVRVR